MVLESHDLSKSLLRNFGFDKFKGQQEEIIKSVLEGNDTFVTMPTGGGKSLCYQLPAMMLDGTAIIVSPLIALMKNQVDSVRSYANNDEVAHFLNSSLTKTQINKVKSDIEAGLTKMLYIAPETLTKEENINFLKSVKISMVAVDEAHCISEWGHDFRPEYRKIRTMINEISENINVIALTATATPKVQSDIVKNLNMKNARHFSSSFNRTNLFYEIRPKGKKENVFKNIVQQIKQYEGKSGIIYVQARKSTKEIADLLNVNGIKAAPYHAGLDAKTRNKAQDDFLMEEVDVIVATIAFGMGIDKPDVRFVIHYDIPKSIENYYQETGRAGRDGLTSTCIAYYSYKDIQKLEKFLRDKPVAEREMGAQLLQEVIGYSETSACRRTYLLNYFGEKFDESSCSNMCDNCKFPREKVSVEGELQMALQVISDLREEFKIKTLVDFITGNASKEIVDYGFAKLDTFGAGKDKEPIFWTSLFSHALLNGFAKKEIEQYGIVKLTEEGRSYIEKPFAQEIPINQDFDKLTSDFDIEDTGKEAVLDKALLGLLKDLRKRISKEKDLPPFVIFQDPSLLEMATNYPLTEDDLANISGVSKGKAIRYGRRFLDLISKYVDDNQIDRPDDFVVKQVANKSKNKVNIIQSIDKKIPLYDIAEANALSMEELLDEMYVIVNAGTRLDINYYIEENVDEYSNEDITDYFMEAESDNLNTAFEALAEDDITLEEIQLVRIAFLSSMAN
jgi:ATP-dependent DNA helicase RecQ